jgi:hypothetical protein
MYSRPVSRFLIGTIFAVALYGIVFVHASTVPFDNQLATL